MTIDAPQRIPVDTPVTILVRNPEGVPVEQAHVTANEDPLGATNASGQITHNFTETGALTLSASKDEAAGGMRAFVIQREWANSPYLAVESLSLGEPIGIQSDHARYQAQLRVTNLGGQAFDDAITATANNETVGQTSLQLAAFSSDTVALAIDVPLDAHAIDIQEASFPIDVASPDENEQSVSLETLLTSQRDTQQGASTSEDAFLDRFFSQLNPVLLIVTLLTFAHAAFAVAFGVIREVRERATIAQTLRHLGASREDIGARAARDAAMSVILPAVAGVGMALLGLRMLQERGWPAAFGHTLPASLSWGLALRIIAALVAVAAGTAAIAAAAERRRKPRQGTERSLEQLLGGSK